MQKESFRLRTCRAEASRSSSRNIERKLGKLFHFTWNDRREDELRDAVAVGDVLGFVGAVEEEDNYFSCVVRVDNSRSIRNKYSTLCKTRS